LENFIKNIILTKDNGAENFSLLENYALNAGMSIFRACDISAVSEGFHPALIQNPATAKMRYAISMAFHLSDSVLESVFTEPTQLYAMHYNRVNSFLDDTALKITAIIQNSGFEAMPVAASQIIDKASQKSYLNHKLVGRAAGTGFIGRNNLLVSTRFGSRMRLVTVLTDAPLAVTAPLAEDCGNCRACISSCPVGAIGENASDFCLPKCVEQISKFQRLMFVTKGICGICVKACRGREK